MSEAPIQVTSTAEAPYGRDGSGKVIASRAPNGDVSVSIAPDAGAQPQIFSLEEWTVLTGAVDGCIAALGGQRRRAAGKRRGDRKA